MIHFGVPEDVETYVQQVGRAERDGNRLQCVMLFGTGIYRRFCNDHIFSICGIAGENRPTGAKFPMEIIDL